MHSPRRTPPLALSIAAALLAVASVSHAASQREMSLEEMCGAAGEIVEGRVVASDARWEGKLIVTVSEVAVDETLKGDRLGRVEVVQLGGTAVHPVIGAPVSMSASGQVQLRAGERVMLFLHREKGRRMLVGGPQGKFAIEEDPADGTERVPVGPKRLRAVREGEARKITPERITLEDLRARVRGYVERQPPAGATEER